MATMQIRGVPDDVHQTYQRRAELAGQSLQEFLLSELVRAARTATAAEVVAAVRADLARDPSLFSTQDATDLVRADRDR